MGPKYGPIPLGNFIQRADEALTIIEAADLRTMIAVAGLILGHVDDAMAGQYRERVDEARLETVANHVRKWSFDVECESAK